jgi:peptidoglycan hydrolase-like protein with peptidoglycan-binding domain
MTVVIILLMLGSLIVNAAALEKPVRYGDRGDEVKGLQKLLSETGFYSGEIDGIFGDSMLYAVKAFQKSHGLTDDGVPGNETITYMRQSNKAAAKESVPVRYGDQGDNVKIAQRILAENGFYAGEIDGVFGDGMLRAVKIFQEFNRLPGDGVVGKETMTYMRRTKAVPDRYKRVLTMTASAYTRYDPGNGSYTSNGNVLRKGLVAVDPHVIPLGTRMYIRGYGYAIADDVGGAIRGNRVDLAFDDRASALQFGLQKVTIYILD